MWEAGEVWVLVRGAACYSVNTHICTLVLRRCHGPGTVPSVTCAVSEANP